MPVAAKTVHVGAYKSNFQKIFVGEMFLTLKLFSKVLAVQMTLNSSKRLPGMNGLKCSGQKNI